MPTDPLASLFSRALAGDRRATARLFTRIENDGDALRDVMRLAHPHSGNAEVVGITGPPGAGKSTIADRLVHTAREEGRTVGVLAVDPTSPFSGGSVLGDRIRMRDHYLDPDVFIRSIATKGAHGGLASVCRAGVNLLDALGKDLILVETVGVGQTELDIMGVSDIVAVVLVPEAGDTVQAMKAGLLEIADIFVVNKADRDGAGQMASAIRAMLSLDPTTNRVEAAAALDASAPGRGHSRVIRRDPPTFQGHERRRSADRTPQATGHRRTGSPGHIIPRPPRSSGRCLKIKPSWESWAR